MNVFILICFVISVIASGVTGDGGCVHGTSKKEFCNNCYCENGSWLCTEQACDFHHKRTERDDFSCTPGQNFKKDCNTCTCTPDGKNAVCTLKSCVGPAINITQ